MDYGRAAAGWGDGDGTGWDLWPPSRSDYGGPCPIAPRPDKVACDQMCWQRAGEEVITDENSVFFYILFLFLLHSFIWYQLCCLLCSIGVHNSCIATANIYQFCIHYLKEK